MLIKIHDWPPEGIPRPYWCSHEKAHARWRIVNTIVFIVHLELLAVEWREYYARRAC